MRYKFIINPAAGDGRAWSMVPLLQQRFREAAVDFDFYTTRCPGDATAAARRAVEEGFNVVVAVGGDGTVNEIANGIVGFGAVLAALPGGKGNDFAQAVNMPRDPEAAIKVLLEGKTKSIDLGKVLGRYFVNTVGVGFDAAVAYRVNQGVRFFKGVSAYVYAVLAALLSYQPVEMEIILDGCTLKQAPTLVAVGIGTSYGGGMKIVPQALQDDGFFDVCVMDRMSRMEMIYHFPKVFQGSHTSLKQVQIYRTRELKLFLGRTHSLHMEGEILFGDRMHFTLEHKGIKVLYGERQE